MTKARLQIENVADKIEFQFNPAEVAITKTSGWGGSATPGRATPTRAEYTGGQAATMTLNIILDTTHTGDSVSEITEQLEALIKIDTENKDYRKKYKLGRPPWVKVLWGDLPSYKWVCTSLALSYVYFNKDGVPLRAKAAIALKQIDDDENPAKTNPTSGTPMPHRVHTVVAGETLDRIAAQHYGKPKNWRMIADANPEIRDVMRIPPGTLLLIPDKRTINHG